MWYGMCASGNCGAGWAAFAIVHVLWWMLVIALGVFVFRVITGRGGGLGYRRRDAAMDILRGRYARGEIDATEFEERARKLGA